MAEHGLHHTELLIEQGDHRRSPVNRAVPWFSANLLAWLTVVVLCVVMKVRECSRVLLYDGRTAARKVVDHECAVCGCMFIGRVEAKACSEECTRELRSRSARNRGRNG